MQTSIRKSSLRLLVAALAINLACLGLRAESETANNDAGLPYLKVTSSASLIHLGSLDSFDITDAGVKAAELLNDYLTTKDKAASQKAAEAYEAIIPSENFGGEYTALQWLARLFASTSEQQEKLLQEPMTREWYLYLASNDFTPLRNYLKMKYHLLEWKHKKTPKSDPEYRFLEDFILFNNPDRERWEKTSKMMEVIPLKPGDKVADVGSGPGFFTVKFAKTVGTNGHVYAIEINPRHTSYVSNFISKYNIGNITPIDSVASEFNIGEKVDLVYLCSLYHNVYATSTEEERDSFISSIKKILKPGGTLIVVDNALVDDKKLPYHGPYIAKELIINQMWYNNFKLEACHQFIPQRYMLVFKLQSGADPVPGILPTPLPEDCVPLNSKHSVLRAPRNSSTPGFTVGGRKAARLFFAGLENHDPAKLREALDAYKALIPTERFGDEYSAFQWCCEVLLASDQQRESMLSDWRVRDYFTELSADHFKMLRTYLPVKYYFNAVVDDEDVARCGGLGKVQKVAIEQLEFPEKAAVSSDQINEWGEFICFNNPRREQWEHTQQMLDFIKVPAGSTVADLGCGPGYYTYKFSGLVGSNGLVYAVDTMQNPLDRITRACAKEKIGNIRTILAKDNDTHLPPNSVDLIYICSMYHAVYMTDMEYVKDGFIASLKQALRPGGRIVVADNSIMRDSENHYFGPGIAPEMIIAQMKHYGFKLVNRAQFIPQRYVLIFERSELAGK